MNNKTKADVCNFLIALLAGIACAVVAGEILKLSTPIVSGIGAGVSAAFVIKLKPIWYRKFGA